MKLILKNNISIHKNQVVELNWIHFVFCKIIIIKKPDQNSHNKITTNKSKYEVLN